MSDASHCSCFLRIILLRVEAELGERGVRFRRMAPSSASACRGDVPIEVLAQRRASRQTNRFRREPPGTHWRIMSGQARM
jgi:hypothetical protein